MCAIKTSEFYTPTELVFPKHLPYGLMLEEGEFFCQLINLHQCSEGRTESSDDLFHYMSFPVLSMLPQN